MSKDQETPKQETPNVAQAAGATEPQSISIQDILNTYPIDREKCRDVVLLEGSGTLRRIADSLDAISQSLIVINTHLSEANKLKK